MRLSIVAAVVLAACAPSTAHAACADPPAGQETDRAEVIVDAVAVEGETNANGQLVSPAGFRVERYDKGTGPAEVLVQTGAHRGSSGFGSEGFYPRPSERWRLFARRSADGTLTMTCAGTVRLDGTAAPEAFAGAAGRRIGLPRTSIAGDAAGAPVPRVRTRGRLFVATPGIDGPVLARMTGREPQELTPVSDRLFAVTVPRRWTRLVVVETRTAFFAVRSVPARRKRR